MKTAIHCYADSARGIYIPQFFAESAGELWNVDAEDLVNLLLGPDHAHYWDTWEAVLDHAQYVDEDGRTWTLHQDGDLFAVCLEEMTDQERAELFGDE